MTSYTIPKFYTSFNSPICLNDKDRYDVSMLNYLVYDIKKNRGKTNAEDIPSYVHHNLGCWEVLRLLSWNAEKEAYNRFGNHYFRIKHFKGQFWESKGLLFDTHKRYDVEICPIDCKVSKIKENDGTLSQDDADKFDEYNISCWKALELLSESEAERRLENKLLK